MSTVTLINCGPEVNALFSEVEKATKQGVPLRDALSDEVIEKIAGSVSKPEYIEQMYENARTGGHSMPNAEREREGYTAAFEERRANLRADLGKLAQLFKDADSILHVKEKKRVVALQISTGSPSNLHATFTDRVRHPVGHALADGVIFEPSAGERAIEWYHTVYRDDAEKAQVQSARDEQIAKLQQQLVPLA